MEVAICGLILCSVLGIPRSFYSLTRDHALLSLNCEDCIGLSFVSINAVCGIKLNRDYVILRKQKYNCKHSHITIVFNHNQITRIDSIDRYIILLSLNCEYCIGLSFVSVNAVCGIKCNCLDSIACVCCRFNSIFFHKLH